MTSDDESESDVEFVKSTFVDVAPVIEGRVLRGIRDRTQALCSHSSRGLVLAGDQLDAMPEIQNRLFVILLDPYDGRRQDRDQARVQVLDIQWPNKNVRI